MRHHVILAALIWAAAAPALAKAPAILTDIPVVQSLVAAVTGDVAAPTVLLDRGADAHSFQLRPSQIRALTTADLVVWIGPELTPWLERVLEQGNGAPQRLTLLQTPGTLIRAFEDAEPDDGDAAADDHGDHGTDPHAWLDPDNVAIWIGEIADALAALDPGNATVYRANATLAQRRVEITDRRIAERLASAGGDGLILTHDAYGYLVGHYGLTVAGTLAAGDAARPGAAHLSRLRALAESGDVVCAFPEAGHDPAGLEQLVEGTSVRIGTGLDPEGRLSQPGDDLFVSIPEAISIAIAECVAGR